MTHDPHTIGPGALLLAEVTSGSVGGHLASALGTIPPWLGGAFTALFVGAALRVADPLLRRIGERLAARFQSDKPSTPEP
jgi:hypothetical protein